MKKICVLFLISMTIVAQSAPVEEPHTAVLFTKQIANYDALAIRGTLDLGTVGLCLLGIKLISPGLQAAATNGPDKTVTIHAMENPYHAFGGAVFTFTAGAMLADAFQSFIGAVQNWYSTPKNQKAILLSNL